MEAVEPVAFEVTGSGLDPKDYVARMSNRPNDWDETHDYILHQALDKHFEELSRYSLMEELREMIDNRLDDIEGYIPGLGDNILNTFMPPIRSGVTVYHMSDVIVVPNKAFNGYFYVVSNNKNKAREIRDLVIEDIEQAPETFGALGVEGVTTFYGGDFTLRCLQETEAVTSIEQGEMDEFEERIFDIVEPISESFIHNVKVSFDHPQEPEYDIVFSLAPGNTLTIEVEDHSGSDNEPDQSDLIDDPSAESNYINASQAFSICKGVSSELLGQFKPKAELTNVNIIEKDQCSDKVVENIEDEMLPRALGMTPSAYVR
jgi:hypothetical protein